MRKLFLITLRSKSEHQNLNIEQYLHLRYNIYKQFLRG